MESGDQWEIRPSDVGYRKSLGQGAFGEVYKAVVRQLGGTRDKVVAVKRLKGKPELPSKMTNVKTVYLHFQIKVEPSVYQSLKNVK